MLWGRVCRAKKVLFTLRGGVSGELEVWWEEGILVVGVSKTENMLEREMKELGGPCICLGSW